MAMDHSAQTAAPSRGVLGTGGAPTRSGVVHALPGMHQFPTGRSECSVLF